MATTWWDQKTWEIRADWDESAHERGPDGRFGSGGGGADNTLRASTVTASGMGKLSPVSPVPKMAESKLLADRTVSDKLFGGKVAATPASVIKQQVAAAVSDRMYRVNGTKFDERLGMRAFPGTSDESRRNPSNFIYATTGGGYQLKAGGSAAEVNQTVIITNNTTGKSERAAVCGTPEADALIREAGVSKLVQSWAGTSNDNSTESQAIQESAKTEFGLQGTAPWHTGEPMLVGSYNPVGDWNKVNGEYQQAFLRAQYDVTQEHLAAAGVSSVTLYRGTDIVEGMNPQIGDGGKTVELDLRPMSSFSTRRGAANGFGANVISAEVPADRILSTAVTGNGCLNEQEVVVLGGVDTFTNADSNQWTDTGTLQEQAIASWAGTEEQTQWAQEMAAENNSGSVLDMHQLDGMWQNEQQYAGDSAVESFAQDHPNLADASNTPEGKVYSDYVESHPMWDLSGHLPDPSMLEAGWVQHMSDYNEGQIAKFAGDPNLPAGAGDFLKSWAVAQGASSYDGVNHLTGDFIATPEKIQAAWDAHMAGGDPMRNTTPGPGQQEMLLHTNSGGEYAGTFK